VIVAARDGGVERKRRKLLQRPLAPLNIVQSPACASLSRYQDFESSAACTPVAGLSITVTVCATCRGAAAAGLVTARLPVATAISATDYDFQAE